MSEINHLEEAKDASARAWDGTNARWEEDAELLLQSAQAFALIAIVERLDGLIEAVGKLPQARAPGGWKLANWKQPSGTALGASGAPCATGDNPVEAL